MPKEPTQIATPLSAKQIETIKICHSGSSDDWFLAKEMQAGGILGEFYSRFSRGEIKTVESAVQSLVELTLRENAYNNGGSNRSFYIKELAEKIGIAPELDKALGIGATPQGRGR